MEDITRKEISATSFVQNVPSELQEDVIDFMTDHDSALDNLFQQEFAKDQQIRREEDYQSRFLKEQARRKRLRAQAQAQMDAKEQIAVEINTLTL